MASRLSNPMCVSSCSITVQCVPLFAMIMTKLNASQIMTRGLDQLYISTVALISATVLYITPSCAPALRSTSDSSDCG